MTCDKGIVKMVATAWKMPSKCLKGLCELIQTMKWAPEDLRRLLHVHHWQGQAALLSLLCEWMEVESSDPVWRSCLRQLQAHWGDDGRIYFTLPKEAAQELKKVPRCKAKAILLQRLQTE